MKEFKYYRNDLLQDAFKSQGWTLRGFSTKTGLSIGTIQTALKGDSMQLDKLKEIAVSLQVDWAKLFQTEVTK